MELSQEQKDLINLLQKLEISTEDIVITMMCCQQKEHIAKMINYLLDCYDRNETITQQKILKKIVEING